VGTEQTYEHHVELIDSVITLICRRRHLSASDAADFRQEAHLKLLEQGTLEKYEGRSSMKTFLLVVLLRAYKDFRIRQWGKWRPSVEAQRNGPVAIALERLIVRDGFTFEEAFETLRTNHGVMNGRAELEALAARLPLRVVRKPQTDDVLVAVPSGSPSPDAEVSRVEVQVRATAASEALLAAVRDLAPDDRLIIMLRYFDGVPIVKIAGLLQIEAKPLYRRIEQLLSGLRRALQAKGVDTAGLFDEPWE
jgi:RNA polymerase sigma factor (sigma-70 family)